MLNLSHTLLLLITLANIAIGTRVLLKNPRHIVNWSFFIFVCASSSWAMGIVLLYITHNFSFDKLALGGGLGMLFGITLFARVFPSQRSISLRFFLIYVPLVICIICLPFNVFISGISIDPQGFIRPINGPLFPLYISSVIGYALIALYFFRKSFMSAEGNSRLQIFYFTTGIGIFMTSLIIFNVILPGFGIYRFNLIGPLTSIVFVLMTSYAIVRHQLMDIRVVIQRGAAYSVLLSLIIATYVSVLFTADYLADSAKWIAGPVAGVIITLIAIATIARFERYFQKITNRFFFKDPYEYAAALESLSGVLNKYIDFSTLLPELFSSLNVILHPEFIEFTHLLKDGENGVTEEIYSTFLERKSSSDEKNTGIQIPICIRERIIGTFWLGQKRSGEPYTDQDLCLLRTFATQAAVAFEKAEFYQELKAYSESLEHMVRERTKNIEELQTHQRQLFDDMSHALQTPITVMKGAIEILRAETHTKETRMLETMEYSVDDVSRLIREILELARLDAIPTPEQAVFLNLSQIVTNVTEYVEVICRQNDIKLSTEIAQDIHIFGNAKQIEEALTNLLSNAVHYTSGRSIKNIHVTLSCTEESVELAVTDTGVGISPTKLPEIFERFYRGTDRNPGTGDGHGLGLAIVKKIMERHGGSARASSILDQGTTMTLSFPLVTGEHILATPA